MSSKFFTWTKGDRSRNAPESLYSGAVVPIPVECIHIKGFDYSRTSKNGHRRPLPLRLEPSPEVASACDHQDDDPTTLQDAAVKSATSLIAVVNDMLRPPLASARLPPPSSTLAPSYGRPRSRTAPSTPLVEAPVHTLVELPGCTPDRSYASHHRSIDAKVRQIMQTNNHAKRSSHPWLHQPVDHRNDAHTANRSHGPSSEYAEYAQPATPQQYPSGNSATRRSSRPGVTPRRIWSDPIQSHGTLHPRFSTPAYGSTHECVAPEVSPKPVSTGEERRISYEPSSQLGDIAQASYASPLQASHEAHLSALMEAHQREITSLHLYIAHIEQHRGLSRTSEAHAHPSMRQRAHMYSNGVYKQTSSWRPPIPEHRDSPEQDRSSRPIENGTSSPGCGELWLECNNLRNSLEAANARLSQSEDTVRRLQNSERSLKATIEDLHRRLLAANDERLDVREGLNDACCRVRDLVEREADLVSELEVLRRCSSATTLAESHQGQVAEYKVEEAEQHSMSSRPDSSAGSSSQPTLSPSQTPSPTDLGISIPCMPCKTMSSNAEDLPVAARSPKTCTQPQTPPARVHKDLPRLPPDASPVPVHLRRGNTVKSVGDSIIEMYARSDGDGWEHDWWANDSCEKGEARWGDCWV